MQKAKDIMAKDVITLSPKTTVKEAAKIFADKGIGGAPVIDDQGNLVGIVSESDLIMRDVRAHFPHYIQLLDSIIFIDGLKRFDEEIKKAIAADIEHVMEKDVITTNVDATIEDVATLMIDKKVSRLPVVKDNKVVGVITKRNIVKAIGR